MTPTTAVDESASWQAEGHALVIRYRIAVLRELCARAAEGFAKIPRGGIEVGGVLYGAHHAGGVSIDAWRPIECEYRSGPSFELSEADRERLGEQLAASRHDPELSGLEPVGWWHSHTRSELALSADDVSVFNRFFPEPWQVAAVLRPAQFEPTRIGFFFRERNGRLRTDASYHEFTLAKRPRSDEAGAEASAPVVERAHRPAPAPAPVSTTARRQRPRMIVAAAVLVATALLAWWLWPVPVPDIALRLQASGNPIISIEWDPRAIASAGSDSVDLHIRDGSGAPRYLHLDAAQAASGRLAYERTTGEVTVRLRLAGGPHKGRDYVASFVGPPVPTTAATSTTAPVPTAPLTLQPEPQKTALPAVKPQQEPVPETATRQRPAEPPAVPPRTRFAVRPAANVPAAAPVLPGPPPEIGVMARLDAGPRPNLSAAPPPRVPARPLGRGRAIWTGELRPGATLSIEGARASFGAISGRLPNGPARIVAHAAELGDGAIVIYSANEALRAREGTFESPSARNGWNLTTYKWDPRRAASVGVVEAPDARNGWKRLVLRGASRKTSVIVLDWEELPADGR